MDVPLLALDHDWHRSRATLRAGGRSNPLLRPPPLVAAGLDVEFGPAGGRRVKVGGLVVIFGHFPSTIGEFAELAKARLHLTPGQARELDPVLSTRVLALWAWLPTAGRDCYLEYDRATDEVHTWLVGPAPGQLGPAEDQDPAILDQWFLDGLVLNGHAAWGGTAGLERLIDRHGALPLLVAAQIADLLEHRPGDPQAALQVARAAWPRLDTENERPWADVAGTEHPFVHAQLGRLALRLGLVRAARALLSHAAGSPDVTPLAWFDLGQACEAQADLMGSEEAFTRYCGIRPQDPDGWRRLLFCRLRRGRLEMAEECLQKYRAHGGKDDELLERIVAQFRTRMPLMERARLAGFLVPRLHDAFTRLGAEADLAALAGIRRYRDEAARQALSACAERVALALHDGLIDRAGMDPVVAHALAQEALRVVLLTLPLLAPAMPREAGFDAGMLLAAAQQGLEIWITAPTTARRLSQAPVLDDPAAHALADLAAEPWTE